MNRRNIPCFGKVWQSTTQKIVFAFGAWFTSNYVAGTVYWPSTITDPNGMHMTHLFGFVPVMVNGWHLYFHLLSGLACMWLASTRRGATTAALLVGGTSVLAGALGLLVAGPVFGLIMVDTFGNWVHVAEGLGLLVTGVVTLRSSKVASVA
jgi:hypothetical protein